jgi:SAM-dependent methyltransferase
MTGEKRKRITKKFKQEQLEKIHAFDLEGIIDIDRKPFDEESHSFYNEVLLSSTQRLVEFFSKQMGKKAVFYDLGCGQGKLIMHLAIETKMSKIVGIELSKERYEKALKNAEEIEFPYTQPSIINDDFRSVDISDATIVYFDNYGYTIEETEEALSRVPEGCLVIYQDHGHVSGDRFLPFPTAFSVTTAKNVDPLEAFWRSHISYRFV